ncbi:glycine N-methyltransferase-like [Lineus longissimus]|uniref:glycine N-methyltransferase-like n=1 Tax=Lineus longissimus TaxID=88925 RepID=UPI002B4D9EF1
MVDSVYRTRSLGVAAEGLPDQYADGKAAKVWELYIGCKNERTSAYKSWLCGLLTGRGCKNLLDVACGTGVDSQMLVDEGCFSVFSTDASDKMLKYALKERWNRRKEPNYDAWVIEEANWLSLVADLEEYKKPPGGFDAVLCMGNSFAHLPDFEGNLIKQKIALENFYAMVKPGGILVIDHRNYDAILDLGEVPKGKNVYYSGDFIHGIKCSNLYVNSRPTLTTLDYDLDIKSIVKSHKEFQHLDEESLRSHSQFRLSYYPHRLKDFSGLLKECFGETCKHEVFGDFAPYDEKETPAYYIHVVEKLKTTKS